MNSITDIHSHILPFMDDGADSVEMSIHMLEIMKEQGVERVVATPHFYPHKEKNVKSFLEKRQNSYEKLMSSDPPISDILLGAEVSVEKDISDLENINLLAIQNTDLFLFELQYKSFSDWMLEEIDNISTAYKLTSVIAHIHRYIPFYTKPDFEKVLQSDSVFQVNAEAFGNFRESHFVKKLIKNDFPLAFGSDSHNLSDRIPNWSLLKKKLNQSEIDKAMALFESHLK